MHQSRQITSGLEQKFESFMTDIGMYLGYNRGGSSKPDLDLLPPLLHQPSERKPCLKTSSLFVVRSSTT
jgi:hypothetical protein